MKKMLIILFSIVTLTNIYSFEIDIEGLESLGLGDSEITESSTTSNSESSTVTKELNLSFNSEDLVFSGDFTNELSFYSYDTDSMNYKLKDSKSLITDNAYQNRLELNLNASYEYDNFAMEIKTFTQYINEDNSSFNFYEGYVTYSPNYNFYMQAGKSSLYWGKGYAFNPVGVINPVKDPDNPELSGEGKNLINFEYTKSYNDNFADVFTGNLVYLFENNETDNGMGNTDNIGTAVKTYFLIFNSDIDFILYNQNDSNKYGFDFSTNLRPELEFHGEYIIEEDNDIYSINSSGDLSTKTENTSSYLLGLKYLFSTGTNVIFEYYSNGAGLDKDSYNNLYDMYESNVSKAFSTYKELGKNPMEKYFYTKLSHPEPFNWLYTTISLSNIMNAIDQSSSSKLNLSYTPYNNVKLYAETAYITGQNSTEFGDKRNHNLTIGATLIF